MNNIANLAQILRKHPDHNAQAALNAEYGMNGDTTHWIYAGWANKRLGLTTSALANPVSSKANARPERIKVQSRDEAVERYREWLWGQLRTRNQAVIEALVKIEHSTTQGLRCAPKRCHCEVIATAVEWLWASECGIDIIFS